VEAVPALRRPPDTGQIVSVDEILAALRALDRLAQTPEAAWARRRELLSGFRRRMREPGSGSDLAR
jgi:plasmid stabilization system protein ParE